MGRIRLLEDGVAERIAAGEVVERPASVVRELLDNAVDAGASRIDVELADGGRGLISVADDGSGMDHEDARLAFERHATSKLRSAEDLEAVATLGFRGEALAAIASVARVELLTRERDERDAARVVVDHGRTVIEEPAARAAGTTVTVTGLFEGVPARRKFLKSAPTELGHCRRALQRVALARPALAIRARHEDRVVLALGPAPDPGARIAEVLGPRWGSALVEVHEEAGPWRLAAWFARADVHRLTSAGIQLFVNRRPVRDGTLIRAVADGFRDRIPAGRYPVACVFLEMPPEEVDVNVHPAKTEVRFRRPRELRALVVGGLSRALGSRAAVPTLTTLTPAAGGAPAAAGAPPAARWDGGVAERREPYRDAGPTHSGSPADPAGEDLLGPGRPAEALAQYNDCFIVARDADGLLIVDQHVAHERLLFERLIEQTGQGALPRQALLFPETLELSESELSRLERHAEEVERAGFAWDRFGPSAVRVREVPAVFGERARAGALTLVLEALADGGTARPDAVFRHLLATVACHGAVRKGMPLSKQKMDYILQGLAACEIPTHCPHGRVISLRVDLGPLEREFGRG